jgi:streptogramin lyase
MSVEKSYKFSINVFPQNSHRVYFWMEDKTTSAVHSAIAENLDGTNSKWLCGSDPEYGGIIPEDLTYYRDVIRRLIANSFYDMRITPCGDNHTLYEVCANPNQCVWFACTIDNATGHILDTANPCNDIVTIHALDAESQARAIRMVVMSVLFEVVFGGRLTTNDAIKPWLERFNKIYSH